MKKIFLSKDSENNESGYSSEEETLTGNLCGLCGKIITGPRIGLITHLGNLHTHATLKKIDQMVTMSELHLVVKIRYRAISRALSISD